MAFAGHKGRRLLASVIDAYAVNDPERVWATAPVDNKDLAQGYRDITYKDLKKAIDRASWWLKGKTSTNAQRFETLSYTGPKDLRYPIIAVAAVKCGKQLLLPSPYITPEAQRHLLDVTKCTTNLYAASAGPMTDEILGAKYNIKTVVVPELEEWLFNEEVRAFPYEKTWEEANSDPWLIFHTSGTTGLPRPIVYTNWMMTSFDAAELMPDADQETMNDHFRNARFYSPLPHLHFVGMTVTLQWTAFLNTILVVAPPDAMTASKVIEVLGLGRATGVIMPPSMIEDISRQPRGLDSLRALDCVYFAGAPLSRPIAEQLVGYCKLQPGMGSTEAGAYFVHIRNDDDWEYYAFRPAMGVKLEHRTQDLYELVFHRQPELERWQQLFKVYPDLDHFPTKDLWTKHPTKPNLWRYAGRTDDLIILSNGLNVEASAIESVVQQHPETKIALVGGQGRPRPFLLIELYDNTLSSDGDKKQKLTQIWPYVVRANERCTDNIKITEDLMIFTVPEKALPRTAKDTVSREPSFKLYASEIDKLYERPNSAH